MWVCGDICDRNQPDSAKSCHKGNGNIGFVGYAVTEISQIQ
ncbi:hypothetical protein [Pseudobutyrivibrio sp.]|nr:hypothetical protein [Pseudobutyrivibrio sp.]